jgi:transcriptional regulator with XRE-family HTH domain
MLPPLRTRLGHAVRRLRTDAGYSQEAFADAIRVHRTYVGSVERGEVNLSLDNIERIAAGLGLAPWELLREADGELGAEVPGAGPAP